MANVLDLLNDAVGSGNAARQVGAQLGIDEATANQAIGAALPMLLGGLAKNAGAGGAGDLLGALDRDHDGSILDDVAGFLGQGERATATGSGILNHVLGSKQGAAADGLGRLAGLDAKKASALLAMLAPLVMGALGKTRRESNLDADGLGDLLRRDQDTIRQRDPGVGGFLGQLLDQDGDGQIGDDVAKLGAGFLGKMLRGR